jgi:hypothetical protein
LTIFPENGNLYGFLAILVGLLFQSWNDARKRRWGLEDAARIAAELEAKRIQTAADLEALLLKAAAELKAKTDAAHAHTDAKIAQVAATAESAYHEANQVNLKIAGLHQAGLAASELVVQATEELKRRTSADQSELVESILEVGEMAKSAYREANQVNAKIANLHSDRIADANDQREKNAATETKIDNIDRVGMDTNQQIHSITEREQHPNPKKES